MISTSLIINIFEVRLYEKTQILKEIFLETLDRKTDINIPIDLTLKTKKKQYLLKND